MTSHIIGRQEMSKVVINATKYANGLENKVPPSSSNLFDECTWMFENNHVPCQPEKLVKK